MKEIGDVLTVVLIIFLIKTNAVNVVERKPKEEKEI